MKNFTKYLQSKDFTTSTQARYTNSVYTFLNWYNLSREIGNLSREIGNLSREIGNAQKIDIIKYLEYLKATKNQNNHSRNTQLVAIKHYFEYLRQSEQIAANPTNLIKIRGTKKKQLYNIYTAEELTQLLDDYHTIYIRNFDDKHIPNNRKQNSHLSRHRNYVILSLLIYQGLHTNEIQKIQLQDINLTKATIKIHGSRQTNEKNLPLKAEQIGVIMHYTHDIRPQFAEHYKEENEQLFLLNTTSKAHREQSKNYNNLFISLRQKIKEINPNFQNFKQIRASVITNWIKTAGLRKAQYYAGHRYISSTESYLPNNIEELKEDITKYNPF
jgi:site-specific recombinase XerD